MILELVYGGAGVALGSLAMRLRKSSGGERRCSSMQFSWTADGGFHVKNERCHGKADNRCAGGNCTLHCKKGGCAGRCLE